MLGEERYTCWLMDGRVNLARLNREDGVFILLLRSYGALTGVLYAG